MADSVNAYSIPLGFAMVAGYDDAAFTWTADEWARFPAAVHVHIETGAAETSAQVIDVEKGDYLPWEAPAAIERKRAQGIEPTVYVSYDAWAATRTEFQLRGVAEPNWWIALWDGVAELLAGAVAKQYAHPPLTGGNYDLSAAADFWPGVDAAFGPGGGTLGDDWMSANEETLNATYKAARYGLNPDDTPTPFALGIKQRFDESQVLIQGLGAAIGQLQAAVSLLSDKVGIVIAPPPAPPPGPTL